VTAPATGSTSARSRWVPALIVLAALLAGGSLAGCGQKGQLYLPNQKKSKVPPIQTQPPQDTPSGAPSGAPSGTPKDASPDTPPAGSPPQSTSPAPS
jgi:predicted small lipoprotein YifL